MTEEMYEYGVCACDHAEGVHAGSGWRGCGECSQPTKYARSDPRFGCHGYREVERRSVPRSSMRWTS